MLSKVTHFLKEVIWRMDIETCPYWMRLLIRVLRFIVLVGKAYWNDGSMLHASALTYITMLAIVPVLTLGLTSLKAFGAGELAEAKILEQIEVFTGEMEGAATAQAATTTPAATPTDAAQPAEQPIVESRHAANALRNLCHTVFDQIDSINFAKIGTVGAVALIFMVISVLGKIEDSFNAIWGISKARPIWRKFTDYLSVIIIAPLLVLAATSLPLLDSISQAVPTLWGLRNFVEALGILNKLVPLLVGTLLFAFLFGFLPNTRIQIPSIFLGALITTVILMIFFKLCMVLQVGIANNSRLYGSLIALPILLFWINSSWHIILLGAEICYVHQHRVELLRESAFSHPSERETIVLALALTLGAARCVEDQRGPLSVEQFADDFTLPMRDVARVASILERNKILVPVTDPAENAPNGYMLCCCATKLTVCEVINACLDNTPGEDLLARASKLEHLGPLAELERRFSKVLSDNFSNTIAEALEIARKARA
ncbi:MAG: YihY/virulence factor BrkB family protein [Kiritimatiellae bacterium]|nr:YihY/virulence factor BrkB family protein [Kiritimatiellia bacterium]